MLQKPKCPIIALEEHYADDELIATYTGLDVNPVPAIVSRLRDVGEARLKAMDADGIDMQVLSHTAPSTQKLAPDVAVDFSRRVNDRLAALIKAHPTRFTGFAALPTSVPQAAADELDRCVTSLGFKGAMIHGLANGVWLDDKRIWPVFARAEKLDVPIYLHPSMPQPAVVVVMRQAVCGRRHVGGGGGCTPRTRPCRPSPARSPHADRNPSAPTGSRLRATAHGRRPGLGRAAT